MGVSVQDPHASCPDESEAKAPGIRTLRWPQAQTLTDRLAAHAILVESDHLHGEGLALDKIVRAGAVGSSSVPA